MQVMDLRRLTGPNLFLGQAGAVIEVRCGAEEAMRLAGAWRREERRFARLLGWRGAPNVVPCADGVSLALPAPADCLYTATEVADWAYELALDHLEGRPRRRRARAQRELQALAEREFDPALRRLLSAAERNRLPVQLDRDHLTIGQGRFSRTWRRTDLPPPSWVSLDALASIPLAVVTGTNGKTTCVRMTAACARASGYRVGMSTTDGVVIDSCRVRAGDLAGPEGARRVLRDPAVELAVLETARGGLRRRGLAVTAATAVLITNVEADHLGGFGLSSLAELADLKWVITRALSARRRGCHALATGPGPLVLNADDPMLVARAATWGACVTYFSQNSRNQVLRAHVARGRSGVTADGGVILHIHRGISTPVCATSELPVTLAGTASHNVDNALAVVGLARAMGLSVAHIANGLRGFAESDNPGRLNRLQVARASVLVDFAHNPHGLRALLNTATRLPARRRALMLGQAGDRSDGAIRALARAAITGPPLDLIVLKAMTAYRRGRAIGEVRSLIRDELERCGVPAERIALVDDEVTGTRLLLEWLRPGDQALVLVHEAREAVMDLLRAHASERPATPAAP